MAKISLRAARINARKTQKDAAAYVGVSNKTMVKWEKGLAFPNVVQALKLCQLYNISFNDIVFLPDNPL